MSSRQRKSVSDSKKSKDSSATSEEDETNGIITEEKKHYGLTLKRVLTRVLLCVGMLVVVYFQYYKTNEKPFALQAETVHLRTHEVPCSSDYREEVSKFAGCVPQRCGRFITDDLVSSQEAYQLLQIFKKALTLGGNRGAASILDLHTGALSRDGSFINVYMLMKEKNQKKLFVNEDFELYRSVKNKIQNAIALHFGVEPKKIFLTHPTFFSELTDLPARNIHDEYWHVHVDKETYSSFHYTSLLYLSDYKHEFTGGRFVFVDKDFNVTVDPKIGRVSAFTSGSENPHFVEPVTSGRRYAMTISFTCDKTKSINTPTIGKLN